MSVSSDSLAAPPTKQALESTEPERLPEGVTVTGMTPEPGASPKAGEVSAHGPAPQTNAVPHASSPAPTPAVPTPIDRLHLATANASKNRDLATLRKLKSSWKTYVTEVSEPDRARVKRELADCLWAIQEITGRTSDRRDALAAYREFILHAPAGGADARTIARMRHLEDMLSDSH